MADNRWFRELDAELPPREDFIARNKAITAHYAGWYVREPRFKWAAMAALTSRQIGDVLSLATGGDLKRKLVLMFLGPAIELMRETNFAVFDDVGWVHHAFLSTGGDPGVIASALQGMESHQDIVEAFTAIACSGGDDPEARRAAENSHWDGNCLLLKHEQRFTVQPRFEKLRGLFPMSLTLTSATSFAMLSSDPVRRTWFFLYALRCMARSRKLTDIPDIRVFAQRWSWIENEVLGIYREAEERHDPKMKQYIQGLAQGVV
jgi:hypothetical protein